MLLASAAAALIQLRGPALEPGTMAGSAVVSLERARDGDTPVLTFTVRADGKAAGEKVRLLVDTGASTTLVSPALAARLGLNRRAVPPDSFDLAGAGKGCRGLRPRRVLLPPLLLADSASPIASGRPVNPTLHLSGAEALVLPVGGLPADVDGVLGAPQLRQLPLWIDPADARLALGAQALREAASSPARRGPASGPTTLPMRWRRGVPLLPLALDPAGTPGSPAATTSALADTGAEGLFLTPILATSLKALAPERPMQVAGACGLQPARRTLVLGPHLPGQDPGTPVQAIVTANPVFQALGVEAIVGQELLRSHRQLWRLDTSPPSLTLW
jgi:predicted aspartyl protease